MITASEAKRRCNVFHMENISDSERDTVDAMVSHMDESIKEVSGYGEHTHTFEFTFCSICNRAHIVVNALLSKLDNHGYVADLYNLEEWCFDSVGHKQHKIGIIVKW